MKLKDFQFVNHFVQNELYCEVEDKEVRIIYDNKTDTAVSGVPSIELHRPSTVTKAIFNLIYHNYVEKIESEHKKDVFSLMLNHAVHDYTYRDDGFMDVDLPPVLLSGTKIFLPRLIIKEIVQPLIDQRIEILPVLFNPCKFTDTCRIIHSYQDLEHYELNVRSIPADKYPFVLCNMAIHNRAAILSHLLIRQLEDSLGQECARKIIKKILLDDEIVVHIIRMADLLENNICLVADLIGYLKSYAGLSAEELVEFSIIITNSKKLGKFAQMTNPQTEKQWTQWSSLLGLIEKQLGSFRGNRQEVSEMMKEIDQQTEDIKTSKREKNKKSVLNMEELLEVSREQWDSHAVEPGKLYETLLQSNRIW